MASSCETRSTLCIRALTALIAYSVASKPSRSTCLRMSLGVRPASLASHCSVREFVPGALTLDEISRLVWAAQGVTDSERRTMPVRAFNDAEVCRLLRLPDGKKPLYLNPRGSQATLISAYLSAGVATC